MTSRCDALQGREEGLDADVVCAQEGVVTQKAREKCEAEGRKGCKTNKTEKKTRMEAEEDVKRRRRRYKKKKKRKRYKTRE